ncbi:MAG: hypothetical protein WCN27_03700 [Alphaproteobacteria bacterium]
MKKIIKASAQVIGLLMLMVFVSSRLQAQPNPGPGQQNSGIGVTSDGPTVPFDGGMSLMLAASGIGYVAKKMKWNK